eukprot:2278892-Prymnesium_polylepis.1
MRGGGWDGGRVRATHGRRVWRACGRGPWDSLAFVERRTVVLRRTSVTSHTDMRRALTRSGSAPCSISLRQMACWLETAAKWSGVFASASASKTLTPRPSSASTSLVRPLSAAASSSPPGG